MRADFMLSEEELAELLDASKPTPVMYLSGGASMYPSPQENVNRVWIKLGKRLGFEPITVRRIEGKDQHWFTAEIMEIQNPVKGDDDDENRQ